MHPHHLRRLRITHLWIFSRFDFLKNIFDHFQKSFQALAMGLDSEGRYQFLNAIANQLRYPNIHTWYFMEVIIYLFGESDAHVQEQIAR